MEEVDGESSRSSLTDEMLMLRPNSVGSNSNSNHVDNYVPPKKKKKKGEEDAFDWLEQIQGSAEFVAASVLQVKHAPLSRIWENVTIGMKLEVENKDVDSRIAETAYWVASVVQIQGYYVLLRYEGFGNDPSGDFWIHIGSESVHTVGWCANKGKPLIPPRSIARKFTDWRNFLVNKLTGARTLPANFQTKLENGLKSQHSVGDVLEVVDKNQISQLKVASVKRIVGRRLHVEYWDNSSDGGFWCHEESRLIHPPGWAKTIGHQISCPSEYKYPDLPNTPYDADYENMNLKVGMKIEAIDPLNLSAICAATIKKVLKRGYVMVRIDCYEEDSTGFDWFCYHISSQSVFPCGFCAANGIVLIPPKDYDKNTFTWEKYFDDTKTIPAPVKAKEKVYNHKFKEGMKIEAADLMDPRLICVATISRVVGRLLRIHFDGWEDDYDQWMDARSPDIYPIGWCELVKHKLEPPRPPPPKPQHKKQPKRGKKKGKSAASKSKDKASTQAKTNDSSSSNSVVHVQHPKSENKPTPKTSTKLSSAGVSQNGTSEKLKNEDDQKPENLCDAKDPNEWGVSDVVEFLHTNDCASYAESFTKHGIDGTKLMTLSKDQIVPLTGMKVGPAMKIFELISQLKKSSSAAKARKSALSK